MNIELPTEKGFTIYSKSGCINCDNIKKLLDANKLEYNVINCDNYLNENKDFFLNLKKIFNAFSFNLIIGFFKNMSNFFTFS